MTSVVIFLVSIVFLFIYIVFTSLIYNQKAFEDFSFFNHFPYEIYLRRGHPNAFLNIFLFLVGAAFSTNFILNAIFNFSVMEIFIALLSVVSSFSLIAIFYLPLSKFKERCTCSILFFTSNIALNALIVVNAIREIRVYEDKLNIIPLVISLLIIVLCLFFIFNPRIFDFNLVKKDTGEKVRPKVFYLAFGEWLLTFTFLFSQLYLLF